MDNKWTKVQEHPVLECGVMTKEDGQVKVTALFKSNTGDTATITVNVTI